MVLFTVIGPHAATDVTLLPISCPSKYRFTVVDANDPVKVPEILPAPAATGPVIDPHLPDEVPASVA